MTADFARERGLEVDLVEYEKLMEEQKKEQDLLTLLPQLYPNPYQ